MKERLIERSWMSYRDEVIPRDVSSVQLSERRRAFYAGASGLWFAIMGALDPESKPTESDLETMAEIEDELRLYLESVKAGVA